MSKRRLLSWTAAGGALITAPLAYANRVEPQLIRVERWTVRIPDLPPAWEGLRAVHLSDFEHGMWGTDRSISARAVDLAVSLRPDVVFITGDIMHWGRWEGGVPLERLTAIAPVYAVLGNHDHHNRADHDGEAVAGPLRDLGVHVLMNGHAWFERDGHRWMVVGIDDFYTLHSDLLTAITGIPRDTKLLALLSHVPGATSLAPQGWFPLMLAGHTHGGQVLPPGPGWLRTIALRLGGMGDGPFLAGWYPVRGGQLYVSRGIGCSILPIRFGVPPEITLHTLTRGPLIPDGVDRLRSPT